MARLCFLQRAHSVATLNGRRTSKPQSTFGSPILDGRCTAKSPAIKSFGVAKTRSLIVFPRRVCLLVHVSNVGLGNADVSFYQILGRSQFSTNNRVEASKRRSTMICRASKTPTQFADPESGLGFPPTPLDFHPFDILRLEAQRRRARLVGAKRQRSVETVDSRLPARSTARRSPSQTTVELTDLGAAGWRRHAAVFQQQRPRRYR